MSKTREKALAFTLLCLIIGVVHFFFGRTILSAVFFVVEIGLFWILGAVIALLFLSSLVGTIFNTDTLDKAEKWIDKKLGFDKECDCDCEDCDCCECDCDDDEDDDDEIECHIKICRKKKECACESENQECECEAECEEEEPENEEAEVTAEPVEEDSSDPTEK